MEVQQRDTENNTMKNVDEIIYGQCDICNKDLIIVEDIVDTGETMKLLIEYFIKQKPNSINIVSMFMRSNNKIDAKYKYKINWCGFKIEDKYIIGYGLDYNNLFRNLKDVYIEYEEK